jgi:hypothetical protein
MLVRDRHSSLLEPFHKLALLANIRLGWKGSNTLAFCIFASNEENNMREYDPGTIIAIYGYDADLPLPHVVKTNES